MDIDFETEPIGIDENGKEVYLKEIWPNREEVEKLAAEVIKPEMFTETYK
jgi:aconitate hydratase